MESFHPVILSFCLNAVLSCRLQTCRLQPCGVRLCQLLKDRKDESSAVVYNFQLLSCTLRPDDQKSMVNINSEEPMLNQTKTNGLKCFAERRIRLTDESTCRRAHAYAKTDIKGSTSNPLVQNRKNFTRMFCRSCEEGQLETLKFIMSMKLVNIKVRCKGGQTPVMLVDINARCKGGQTPVMLAAGAGRRLFDYLVRKTGCDVKFKDDNVSCILHLAGTVGIVKTLIEEMHMDKEILDSHRQTPLLAAVSRGEIEIDKYLLSQGCNMSARDKRSYNCVHIACKRGPLELIELFLPLTGLDKTKYNRTEIGSLLLSSCFSS